MKVKLIVVLSFLSLLAYFGSTKGQAQTATPTPRLTAAQAITIAQSFANTINQPEPGAATATYTTPESSGDADHYYLPVWEVKFATLAHSAEVVDATGEICDYSSSAASADALPPYSPAGTAITTSSAMQKAVLVMQASGTNINDLTAPSSPWEIQLSNPPEYKNHIYSIEWKRQTNGVSYQHSDGAVVMLQAETGEILEFRLRRTMSVPTSTAVTVTQAQAEQLAQQAAQSLGAPPAPLSSTKQEIVRPNTFWVDGSIDVARPLPGTSRIVWNCYFVQSLYVTYYIWIDAQTGQVVGGYVSGIQGFAPKKQGVAKAKAKTKAKAQAEKPGAKNKARAKLSGAIQK